MIDRARLAGIVREAGRIAMARWPGGDQADGFTLEVWEKTPGDPVSEIDLAVDHFLKRELSALLPAAGWLSEETVDAPDRLEQGLLWLVDPIDGTRDYVRGRKGWAVSVALVSSGRPLLGMLSAPAQGQFWHGEAGQGSWRNGQRLVASQRRELAGARVPARIKNPVDSDLVFVDQPNSIALRMAMVAADIGAAALIAREAGAAVTDAFGQPLGYNKRDPRDFGVLVTAPAIHAAAVARLADRARELSS
jgi:myo-inositol-1(or 4)-monophosphatase